MDSTGATLVKKRINWPHEGVFVADGKPVVYSDLTLIAFVQRYSMVLNFEMDTRVNHKCSNTWRSLWRIRTCMDRTGSVPTMLPGPIN